MADTFHNLLAHIVFSTKFREPTIRDEFREELYAHMGGIIRREGARMLLVGGTFDHVHVVVTYRPAQRLADLVNRLKSCSTRWVNENRFIKTRFGWQTGYGAFSVSESRTEQLKEYIRNQSEHHRRWSFQDEFIQLLERHRVSYQGWQQD